VASGTGLTLGLMGAGAVFVFIGIALLSARIVPVLATWLGWPATKIAGAIGRLARDNARRNPQRTASTASALMIGLALVTLVAMLSAGIISNFRSAVNDLFTGNYAITAQNNFSPVPISAGAVAGRAPGVTAVGSVRSGEGLVLGHREQLTAVDAEIGQVIRLEWTHGSQAVLAALGSDGAFTTDSYASQHHLRIGSDVTITTATGTRARFVIRGVFKPPDGGSPFGALTISAARWDGLYQQPQNLYTFVKMTGGETRANQAALTRAELTALHGEAGELGLDVLVEVHDAGELETALELGAQIIGINNRDLRDFSVDVRRTEELMDGVPGGMLVVSESGISDAAQLQRLRERGVQAVLVGETLMRSADPEAALRGLAGL